jgi:Leucine-rich repeat (LRR) protein
MPTTCTFLSATELQLLRLRHNGNLVVPPSNKLLDKKQWLNMTDFVNTLEDDTIIHIENCIGELPDLSRFTKMRVLRISGCIFIKPVARPFPSKIQHLFVGNTNLRDLPEPLPFHLTRLCVEYSDLTALPTLPYTITELSVSNCRKLTSLPSFGPWLTQLHVPKNAIQRIPPLPRHLHSLICFDNQLEDLPVLPRGIRAVSCQRNPLTFMPSEIILYPSDGSPSVLETSIFKIREIQLFRKLYYTIMVKNALKRNLWRMRERRAMWKWNPDDLDRCMKLVPEEWTEYAANVLCQSDCGFAEAAQRMGAANGTKELYKLLQMIESESESESERFL